MVTHRSVISKALQRVSFVLLAFMASSFADLRASQAKLVDLSAVAPDIVQSLAYKTQLNFTGQAVPGYEDLNCKILPELATALKGVHTDLSNMGLSLEVFDCYRPQVAVDFFVQWVASSKPEADRYKKKYFPNVSRQDLIKLGYIAAKSGHTKGNAVDLGIEGLDFGSDFDMFDSLSHTASQKISVQARANRMLLKTVMEKHCFKNYRKEWWHFFYSPCTPK